MKFKPGDLVRPSQSLIRDCFYAIRPSRYSTDLVVVDHDKYITALGEVLECDNMLCMVWWITLNGYNRLAIDKLKLANEK